MRRGKKLWIPQRDNPPWQRVCWASDYWCIFYFHETYENGKQKGNQYFVDFKSYLWGKRSSVSPCSLTFGHKEFYTCMERAATFGCLATNAAVKCMNNFATRSERASLTRAIGLLLYYYTLILFLHLRHTPISYNSSQPRYSSISILNHQYRWNV